MHMPDSRDECVQISLVAQPEFTYNLSVQGGDITFLPGLEVFINSFIRESLLRPYVLPEGLNVSLDGTDKMQVPSCPGDDMWSFSCSESALCLWFRHSC